MQLRCPKSNTSGGMDDQRQPETCGHGIKQELLAENTISDVHRHENMFYLYTHHLNAKLRGR